MTGIPLTSQHRSRLRAAMKRLGLTQQALADAAGTSQPHLNDILAGRKNPTEPLLAAICGALGLGGVTVETRVRIG